MSIDQGPPKRHALGVDFGTSNTVAVARWPDGRARPILIDGSPLLPSAVYAEPDGHLLVGRDAVHSSRIDPARFEPNPKRRIDDGEVLLADREVPVGDLAPTTVYGQRVPPSGDLLDLGDARVVLLLLVGGVDDRPRDGVVLLPGDEQQRPTVGVPGVDLVLGPRVQVGQGGLPPA